MVNNLSTRICPSCVRPMNRILRCSRCGYESETGVPSIEELATGARTLGGATWNDVDLGGYARAVAPALAAALLYVAARTADHG